MPSTIVMSPVVAVTSIVPTSVVVRSPPALCVTPVPPVRLRSPVVEMTTALTVSSPAALSVTLPSPWAVTALERVMAPAVVLTWMGALLAVVMIVLPVVMAPPATITIGPVEVLPEVTSPRATPLSSVT